MCGLRDRVRARVRVKDRVRVRVRDRVRVRGKLRVTVRVNSKRPQYGGASPQQGLELGSWSWCRAWGWDKG